MKAKEEFIDKWKPQNPKQVSCFKSELDTLLKETLNDFTEYVKFADNMPNRELIKQFIRTR